LGKVQRVWDQVSGGRSACFKLVQSGIELSAQVPHHPGIQLTMCGGHFEEPNDRQEGGGSSGASDYGCLDKYKTQLPPRISYPLWVSSILLGAFQPCAGTSVSMELSRHRRECMCHDTRSPVLITHALPLPPLTRCSNSNDSLLHPPKRKPLPQQSSYLVHVVKSILFA
jgi:hypothetical protein